jgi:uncharacterized protein (DUF305 family)
MKPIYRKQSLVAVLLMALLAACGGASAEETAEDSTTIPAPRIIQPGAPGEPSAELTPEYVAQLEPLPHTEADVLFMQMMIQHHRQALEMTALVPDRTAHEGIPLLAERMDISQTDEVVLMETWLEEREETPPAETEGHVHESEPGDELQMTGMLTEAQMAELEAAEGEEFDRLFLEYMIQHHRGALDMIDQLIDADGGQEAEIGQYTLHVYADQEIEINRMEMLLAEMAAAEEG